MLSRDQIRAIFLSNGFTFKEGMSDLKPYVYEAAESILAVQRESDVGTIAALRSRVAELETALHRTEVAINTLDYCYGNRPENFALALTTAKSDALTARDVLDAKQ